MLRLPTLFIFRLGLKQLRLASVSIIPLLPPPKLDHRFVTLAGLHPYFIYTSDLDLRRVLSLLARE